jgi:hypothetical protein|tara:strand:+ start:918 stop:1571 length:654 start_codon:yes stop_codon:yes gene_type:complete
MATSGTFTFNLTVDEMITEAYERCEVSPQNLTQYDAETARRSLNLMFTDWSVQGINYWTLVETTQTLTQGTNSYVLPTGTLDVFSMVIRRSNTDSVMQRASLTQYHEQPNKDAQGKPSLFFLDRQLTPVIYVWNSPENSTDQLIYWRMQQIEDISLSNSTADVPVRWTEALCAGLAAKLAVKKNKALLTILQPLATEAFKNAGDDEREKASLKIVPG